jgi:hypothetical protein
VSYHSKIWARASTPLYSSHDYNVHELLISGIAPRISSSETRTLSPLHGVGERKLPSDVLTLCSCAYTWQMLRSGHFSSPWHCEITCPQNIVYLMTDSSLVRRTPRATGVPARPRHHHAMISSNVEQSDCSTLAGIRPGQIGPAGVVKFRIGPG